MKRFIYAIVALLVVGMATGCDKEEGQEKRDMRYIGSWHCIVEEIDAEIYATFEGEGFVLYQRLGEGRFRAYSGTCELKGTTLSGVYADQTPWGDSYTVAFVDDNTMTLTAIAGEETHTYLREDIPAEVIEESITVTRIVGDAEHPLL